MYCTCSAQLLTLTMDIVVIRYNGCMYKVAKAPYESDERAHDRAWYLVKHTPEDMLWAERVCRSHMSASKKHDGMTFQNDA